MDMEAEFLEIDSKDAWTQVYQQIRQQSNNYKFTCQAARKLENKNLNRYRDVSPYDHTRVKLQRGTADYINASLVEVPDANRAYILTQGPLPATAGHFWLMVWEQKSRAVLMLNKVLEKNAIKCHQYWPMGKDSEDGEEEMHFADVNLTVTFQKEVKNSNYTLRELLLTDLESGKKRVILHFHYTSWPDFGVPESPSAFLDLLMAVRQCGVLDRSVGPPIVHCSAGIGRSGTFCLVDSCLAIIEETRDPSTVSVQEMLLKMRKYRMGLIQTADQLRFSYLAILAGEKYCTHNNNNNRSSNRCAAESSSAPSHDQGVGTNAVEGLSTSVPDGVGAEKDTEDESVEDRSTAEDKSSPPPPLPPRGGNRSQEMDEDQDVKRDLRRRKREETQAKLASKVQHMRQKQQDAESSSRRRLLVKRLSLGIALLMGTSLLVYRYYLKS